jgi:hypothetical protein
MPNRTPERDWGRLFNFAGGGIVHNELFALFLMSQLNPSLFEAIAAYLFPYGTHSARPTASNTPLQSFYYETDTEELYQNQSNAWVQVASIGGGGSGVAISVNGTPTSDQALLNFLDTASVTWSNPADGDIEATAAGSGGGGLTLIEHKLFTANATTYTFSSLDGNTDGAWCLKTKIKNNSGSGPFYTIAPNGASSNFNSGQFYQQNGSAGQSAYTDKLTLGFANANATLFSSCSDIYPRKTANSVALQFTYCGNFINYDGSTLYQGTAAGQWNETSTNVTSLVLGSSISNGLGSGSEAWLYKYEQ